MKVTFRCKQSGNFVSFTDPTDIETMRKEAHYEEVKDVVKVEEAVTEVKRRGRPSKQSDAFI